MASSIFQRTVVDEQGNIVTGAVVEVRNELTDELAPIFVDRPLSEVKANPFTTDSTGFIKFFVGRGEYRIKATFGDSEIVWRFVQMLDTDYLVNLDVEQTLENKTLIEPVIETISNAGLLTLPAATDTLVGRATTDTLTNKTLTSPTINGGNITGITDLAVADGGTGRSTLTANNVLIGSGTSAVNFVAPGAVDNVLKSNGTQWVSGPFTATGAGSFTTLSYTGTFTGGTGVVNLGSGQLVKDANGNVGIGTSSPKSTLDLGENTGGTQRLSFSGISSLFPLRGGGNISLGMGYQSSTTVTGQYQSSIAFAFARAMISVGGSQGVRFFADGASTVPVGNNITPTERMRIDSAGQQSSTIVGFSGVFNEFKCRAFVNFDGTGPTIRASGNVSSITRVATGRFFANFTTPMPDTNYSAVGGNNRAFAFATTIGNFAPNETGRVSLRVNGPNGSEVDASMVTVHVFR